MRRRATGLWAAAVLAAGASIACQGERAPDQADSAAGIAAREPAEPSPTRAAIDACAAVAQAASRLAGAQVSQMSDSFPAFSGPEQRYGCVVRVDGPASPATPMPIVATTLPDSLGAGWSRDSTLLADGPSEAIYGLWNGDVLCLVRARWAGGTYGASIGCEQLPDRAVPRG